MTSIHKFALLGCGKIANKHSEIISSLGTNCKLVAVCDLDRKKAQNLASKYKVEAFTDMKSMVHITNPDTIVILTPSGLHAQNIRDLSTFHKRFIVEKPLSLKLEDAEEIGNICIDQNIDLSVVKQNRFNKPIKLLKEYLDQGKFGKTFLSSVRVRWSRSQAYYDEAEWRGTWKFDGGVVTNQASHHIDMMQWLMGEVESVFAKGGNFGSNIEAEDTAVACINFSSGALGTIEVSTAIRPSDIEGSISVMGTEGSIEVGGFSMNNLNFCNFKDFDKGSYDSILDCKNPENDRNYAHRKFYLDYLSRQEDNSNPMVDCREALKSLSIIHAIYRSIEEKREVFLSEDNLQSKLGT